MADVKFSAAQLAALEERFEAALMRHGLLESGVWGDVASSLLPEVYGEPAALPVTPCPGQPGSRAKLDAMAARREGGRSLRHPLDAGSAAGCGLVPARTEERDHGPIRARRRAARGGYLFDVEEYRMAMPEWVLAGVAGRVRAYTRSEARAQFKRLLSLKRLPPGVTPVRAGPGGG